MTDDRTNDTPSTSPHGGDTGYEKGDVNVGRMIFVAALVMVLTVVIVLILDEVFLYEKEAVVQQMVLAPESKPLRELLAHEDQVMNSYAVVDTANGIYRIPIDRAMQLVADEAYQERTAKDRP